ncbi:DUF6477 family protein [Paracoccus sp. SSJ]|uniref:DUF6477 family protein n=1 Tax=Paracoccus sp. SSJ TaxID=3050636 RepID=UPI00254D9B78|nr:DUF6477 family protein [Paracoccus sp. SSJ]MDK8873211.1 DUF6477 family protein [Paracoccus sp. SSJ]
MTMMENVIAFQPRLGQPQLSRPRLLVRAARAGLAGWSRRRDLRRVLKCDAPPPAGMALARLLAEEERLDLCRRQGMAGYDMHRHIMLLIAILAETAEAAPRPVLKPVTCL